MTRPKHIAVIVATPVLARAREALRAAVGLSLRGDALVVTVGDAVLTAGDPAIDKAVATLRALGHRVNEGNPGTCDAAEVWT